jgi:hypothetical protein
VLLSMSETEIWLTSSPPASHIVQMRRAKEWIPTECLVT